MISIGETPKEKSLGTATTRMQGCHPSLTDCIAVLNVSWAWFSHCWRRGTFALGASPVFFYLMSRIFNMNIDLSNRVVAVTGGSAGIGAAIAKMAAQCGAKVAVIARDEDRMQEIVSEIENDGGQAMAAKADVTKSDEVDAAFNQIAKKYGRIDGVVANAGINGTWAPIDQISPEQWRKTIDVNLTGTYLTIHHSVPHLRQQGSGR